MKRNTFVKLCTFGLLGHAAVTGNLTPKKKTAGIVQVKEFTAETVTQEIAAEICSLVAWNHLNESQFAGKLEITQQFKYVDKKGPGHAYTFLPTPGYTKEKDGIEIFSPITAQRVTIWPDGDWSCVVDEKELVKYWTPEFEYICRDIKTGKERPIIHRQSGHGLNQLKVADLYIRLGFYKYQEV